MLRKVAGAGIVIGLAVLLITNPLSSTSWGQALTQSILDIADSLLSGRLDQSQMMTVFIVSSIACAACAIWAVVWRGEAIHHIHDDDAFNKAMRLAHHPVVFTVLIIAAVAAGVTGRTLF